MVTDNISCPHCGKIIDVGIPSKTEITQIKRKSIWNRLSFRKGSGMESHCKYCGGRIAIWFRKKSKWDIHFDRRKE